MKNIVKHLLTAMMTFLVLFCITACGKGNDGVSASSDLKADFFEASWKSVEGATEYVVKIGDKEYRTKNTSFSLFDHILPGETRAVSVKAVGDSISSADSEWKRIEYTAESVTKGLIYMLLSDGTYSVYCPSDAIPENGELVLPDTYNGEPVTVFRSQTATSLQGSLPVFNAQKSTSDYSGYAYTGISKVRLPATLSEIRDGALYQASILDIYIPDSVRTIGGSAFEGCESLTKITLSSTLRNIYNFAFSDCSALTEIVLPEGVALIGTGAFARTGLTEITLPEGVTRIEAYSFYGCEALSKIEYSDGVEVIGKEAFHNTLWYNSQPDGALYHKHFLYEYKGEMPENTVLTIEPFVKRFATDGIFKNETNLVSVTLPTGFLSIPNETFSGCTSLRHVTLSEGLTHIGNGAFYSCPIEQIALPESLKTLGDIIVSNMVGAGAFENCTNLVSVIIPGGVTSIGYRCFYGCTGLESVTIEEGVGKIDRYAFTYCTALDELTLSDSTTRFYLTAVAYTGITSLVFPKNLEREHFYSIESGDGIAVSYLVIQKGTKLLDYNFFYRCDGLNTFYFTGTEEEWKTIEIMRELNRTLSITSPSYREEQQSLIAAWENALMVYFYSETDPAESGNYWHYVDGVPTVW